MMNNPVEPLPTSFLPEEDTQKRTTRETFVSKKKRKKESERERTSFSSSSFDSFFPFHSIPFHSIPQPPLFPLNTFIQWFLFYSF
eukprot:gene4680-3373_t